MVWRIGTARLPLPYPRRGSRQRCGSYTIAAAARRALTVCRPSVMVGSLNLDPDSEIKMAQIGVNAWVWSSPVHTEEFGRLAPIVAGMGFDLIEVGIESTGDLDYGRAAEIAKANGLAVSVCAAMGPDRDLIHADERIRASGMDYLRHCIEAAQTLGAANVVGPLYSAVGRTWQATDDERKR